MSLVVGRNRGLAFVNPTDRRRDEFKHRFERWHLLRLDACTYGAAERQ